MPEAWANCHVSTPSEAPCVAIAYRDERSSVRFRNVVNVDDVGMIQRRGRLGLLHEAALALRVLQLFRRQNFHRAEAVQVRLTSLPHHPHAAFTEFLDDVVMQECLPGHARLPGTGFVYHTSGRKHLNDQCRFETVLAREPVHVLAMHGMAMPAQPAGMTVLQLPSATDSTVDQSR